MKMNWKPALWYQLRDQGKGAAIFFLVIVILTAALATGLLSTYVDIPGEQMRVNGLGVAAAIYFFVVGIVQPRPNLRLCLQFGISRRTAFFSQILAVMTVAFLLAIAEEILLAVMQGLFGNQGTMEMTNLYSLLYLSGASAGLSFGEHLLSVFLNVGMIVVLNGFGMFFTFLFWRLTKVWIVVAAVSIPVLCNVIPWSAYWLGRTVPVVGNLGRGIANLLGRSVWWLLLGWILLAAIFWGIDWLLVRRANIKEPSGK